MTFKTVDTKNLLNTRIEYIYKGTFIDIDSEDINSFDDHLITVFRILNKEMITLLQMSFTSFGIKIVNFKDIGKILERYRKDIEKISEQMKTDISIPIYLDTQISKSRDQPTHVI